MRLRASAPTHSHVCLNLMGRACQLVVLLALFGGLMGTPVISQSTAWAQQPMGPGGPGDPGGPGGPGDPGEPGDPVPDEEDPAIEGFGAIEYPGIDHWLISGQVVGCQDLGGIGVTIGGTISASVSTDSGGYFEALVVYGGTRDSITGDAQVNGQSVPQVVALIGA